MMLRVQDCPAENDAQIDDHAGLRLTGCTAESGTESAIGLSFHGDKGFVCTFFY